MHVTRLGRLSCIHSFIFHICLFLRSQGYGVLLEPVPAVIGQRQGDTLDLSSVKSYLPKNSFKTQTQLLSCPKLADIAIRQAPAAANYKQIWCWVTKIPWPHGGIMRKVSNSPSFFVSHPIGMNRSSHWPPFQRPTILCWMNQTFLMWDQQSLSLGCNLWDASNCLNLPTYCQAMLTYTAQLNIGFGGTSKYRLQCLHVAPAWLSAVVKTAWKYKAENNVKM